MKNIQKAVRASRRASEWHTRHSEPKTYKIDEVEDITEEVCKTFDDIKDKYDLKTDEIEKPKSLMKQAEEFNDE